LRFKCSTTNKDRYRKRSQGAQRSPVHCQQGGPHAWKHATRVYKTPLYEEKKTTEYLFSILFVILF
jgi:hypothetical protein